MAKNKVELIPCSNCGELFEQAKGHSLKVDGTIEHFCSEGCYEYALEYVEMVADRGDWTPQDYEDCGYTWDEERREWVKPDDEDDVTEDEESSYDDCLDCIDSPEYFKYLELLAEREDD